MGKDFDVVIVGAGPAGCVFARDLARSGFDIALFDIATRDKVGKPIILEVDKPAFCKAQVALPKDDEVLYNPKRIRVFSPFGKQAFLYEGEHPSIAIYFDKFVERLLSEAEASGAKFFEKYEAIQPVVKGAKVCGVIFKTRNTVQEVRAPLVVDASGFNAALVRKLDPKLGIEFEDNKNDIVVAENSLHDIDPKKAEDAIRCGLCADEEIWTRLGFQGSYSTEYFYLSVKKRKAYILIGLKEENNIPPVKELISNFKKRKGFFARRLYGGGGKIRITHSLDKLVADGFMAIGEAACQVIPAHGSGVASALYAGHLAAQVAAEALKSGEPTTKTLWQYAYRYQSTRGATLAAFDVNRRVLEKLTQAQIASMLESGIVCAEDIYSVAVPRLAISLRSIPKRALGFIKNPSLIAPLVKMSATIFAVINHYRKYPKQYDEKAFDKWKNRTKELFAQL